ncbi:hypothetical protein [Ruminococcus sp.]|uniref:hypothetical protein n=1 Tax=Ruminococcus sp. TaxID=41978 RepID=UPI0025FFC970|nr:hypothetical protein [Ruminococcus sp.]MCI5815853.1 hypothetical protein [Ruminococcus sp.]MDD7555345.1 hypothetical protein [Ruminococcus sp.]MDY4964328.1 hypothetical protein [Ruminococcus callidus]
MIKLITGKKGTGKTKILVDMINNAVKDTNGDLICIEKGAKLTYDISYKVRLVDADRFAIEGYDAFYGFIAGMFAGNYDIKEVFIDGILKIGGTDFDELGKLLEKLNILSGNDTQITFTISADNSELPESVMQFV